MYSPKRGYEDMSYDRGEYYPARALSERDQTLLDTTVTINNCSLDKSFGYFVSRCIHGDSCANDVHGLHYQTEA